MFTGAYSSIEKLLNSDAVQKYSYAIILLLALGIGDSKENIKKETFVIFK